MDSARQTRHCVSSCSPGAVRLVSAQFDEARRRVELSAFLALSGRKLTDKILIDIARLHSDESARSQKAPAKGDIAAPSRRYSSEYLSIESGFDRNGLDYPHQVGLGHGARRVGPSIGNGMVTVARRSIRSNRARESAATCGRGRPRIRRRTACAEASLPRGCARRAAG